MATIRKCSKLLYLRNLRIHFMWLLTHKVNVTFRRIRLQGYHETTNRPLYRVIQEKLPPLTKLISDDILSKTWHIHLGPIHNIYRVTFVFEKALL
jgi:hypothetical protein